MHLAKVSYVLALLLQPYVTLKLLKNPTSNITAYDHQPQHAYDTPHIHNQSIAHH